SDLSHLLQKIQGLPPAIHSLNLELTVLYNTVIFHINTTGGFICKLQEQLSTALKRVLVAKGQERMGDKTSIELWEKVLTSMKSTEINSDLLRLAGLQNALWLAENKLETTMDLFHILVQDYVMADQKQDLLQLIKAWKVPQESEENILSLESACHVKDILYTSVAFLEGLSAMEAEDFNQAVAFLHEAASGLCTKKVLSEVYTCLGFSFYKMGKPQTALQFWKKALSVDFHCLSALYHTSCLYRDMGRIDSELEALHLLHMAFYRLSQASFKQQNIKNKKLSLMYKKALESNCPKQPLVETLFLVRTELILKTSILGHYVHVPTSWEVKYLIANRSLKNKSPQEAAEHYMDLMTALLNESQPKSLYPSPASLPRIPVIYLEAAAALLVSERFKDGITVCEEVLENLVHVSAGDTRIVDAQTNQKTESSNEQLNCVLWASSAHYLQGEAQGRLEDHKDSISEYTRCVNLLMKLQFVDSDSEKTTEHHVYTFLKASAFLGRSHQFLQIGNLKSALMNVRLALQVMPGFSEAAFYLTGLLWKIGDKEQAGLEYRKYQSKKHCLTDQYEATRRKLPLHLAVNEQKGFLYDKMLIKEVENYVQINGWTVENVGKAQ
ncbi:Fanconi anemia group G protein, partial [Gastrophryne carolinensis]